MRQVIVGAGAHGRQILEILRARGERSIAFVDDRAELWGSLVSGTPVSGGISDLLDQDRSTFEVIIGLGSNPARLRLAERFAESGCRFLNAIHPSATVASTAVIGSGTMIGPGAILQPDVHIANHVNVGSGCIVEHDSIMEDGSSLAPGALLASRSRLGRGSFVAYRAVVLSRVTIGAGSIVGAGSTISRDVPEGVLCHGSAPPRFTEKVGPDFDWSRLL